VEAEDAIDEVGVELGNWELGFGDLRGKKMWLVNKGRVEDKGKVFMLISIIQTLIIATVSLKINQFIFLQFTSSINSPIYLFINILFFLFSPLYTA